MGRADDIIRKHAGEPVNMFGPGAEEMLSYLDEQDPGMANALRRIRDRIAKGKPQDGLLGRADHAGQLDLLTQEQSWRDLELPQAIRDMFATGRDIAGVPLRGDTEPLERLRAAAGARGLLLVVLSGPPGTGKTMAACQWLAEIDHGLFVFGPHLTELSRQWRGDEGRIWKYRNANPLVIDDVGIGCQNESERARIEEFLVDRYEQRRVTVCTTNKEPVAFLKDYGQRVASRLRALGSFVNCQTVLRSRRAV